jgi:hypothetical protein
VLGAAKEQGSMKQKSRKLNSFTEEYESNSFQSSRSFGKVDKRLPKNGSQCFACNKEGNCEIF